MECEQLGLAIRAYAALAENAHRRGRKVLACLVTNASGAPDFLVERIEQQAKRMEFMPGYFEGKPVSMLYIEPVFD